jgi:hypothetical protein
MDHDVLVTFTEQRVTITASTNAGGLISYAGDATFTLGSTPTYLITPDNGYVVADVLVDTVSVGAVSSYTFEPLADNHSIEVVFEALPTTVNITSSAGTGGTITPEGSLAVDYNGSQTYAIAADTGYRIVSVVVDGIDRGPRTSWEFTNVQEDHTIVASFEVDEWTITTAIIGQCTGTISPEGPLTVAGGSSQAFTITPDTGCEIADVEVDGDSVGAVANYTLENISSDHDVLVTFKEQRVTITASKNEGGVISYEGEVLFALGSTPIYYSVPDKGYQLVDVLVDSESIGAKRRYSFDPLTEGHTIEAVFAPK